MQDDDVTKITGMGQFERLNPTVYQAKWEAVAKEINKILGMEGFGTYVPEMCIRDRNWILLGTTVLESLIITRSLILQPVRTVLSLLMTRRIRANI